MNKKQKAVEWLEEQLNNKWVNGYLSPITIKPLIEQALQMEQEQIEEVAMYHKDSAVEIECIRSYIKKNYGGQDEM